jgi:hypothetical protein
MSAFGARWKSLQQAALVAETNLACAALRIPFRGQMSFSAVGSVGTQFRGAMETLKVLP